jgi:predicted PurR-regulated permease PerM
MENFNSFGLPEQLVAALKHLKFDKPTPIQAQVLPPALEGKDILGSAQTGTGKTAAFGIPLVTKLMLSPQGSALVMTPTRELAVQVMLMIEQLLDKKNGTIKTALLIGGESIQKQFHIQLLSEQNLQQVQQFMNHFLTSALSGGLNALASITMMYFFLYFMLVNINRLEAAILHYLPFSRRKILVFGEELQAQTFSNAVGVPLVAFGQGFTAYIGYLICGVPDAGFWAILTGATSILPIIGTGLFWIPIAAYLVMQEQTWQAIFLTAWGILVMGTIDNVIRFILAKKMANVHPLVTVLGVIIGLQTFGITGLVFGPLIISYFIILMKIYYSDYFAHPDRKSVV